MLDTTDIKKAQKDTLMIAIGNSGRQDDGLAWAFSDFVEESGAFEGDIQQCYQLQVEDAELITRYKTVIFVDASYNELSNGYDYREISFENDFTFTTHAVSPMGILYLCHTLYHACPKAYLLEIQGYQWELEEGLSMEGKKSLNACLKFWPSAMKNA